MILRIKWTKWELKLEKVECDEEKRVGKWSLPSFSYALEKIRYRNEWTERKKGWMKEKTQVKKKGKRKKGEKENRRKRKGKKEKEKRKKEKSKEKGKEKWKGKEKDLEK